MEFLQQRLQFLRLEIKHLASLLIWGSASLLVSLPASAQPLTIELLYLEQTQTAAPVLSNIIPEPQDSGLSGAQAGIIDNNTTGRFLKHRYRLSQHLSDDPRHILEQAHAWQNAGNRFILANLPSDTLLALMDEPSIADQMIIFNIANQDDRLRTQECRSGLLHTIPSRAMLTDALAQFLIRKDWKKWLLLVGQRSGDRLFQAAIQRSAKRFGGKIIDLKTWSFDTDQRRTTQLELPVFTQGSDYQVTLVADESGDFGEYVPYNTWLPRPVAGTQGLTPVAWHRVVEQWGAAQLQSRFEQLSGRWMNSEDYAAWLATRVIAEAVTRTESIAADLIYSYLLSDKFQVAAFKGRPLSFRNWNGQLRQPIPLVHPRALVSQSPQEGFLHPLTDLDTLGFDQSETHCDFRKTIGN